MAQPHSYQTNRDPSLRQDIPGAYRMLPRAKSEVSLMSSDANDSLHCGYMYIRDSHLHPGGVSLGDSSHLVILRGFMELTQSACEPAWKWPSERSHHRMC